MRRTALVLACAALLLTPAAALAQRNRDEDLVRNWYRDYLGREVGPELSAWTTLLRGGMSPLDVQATILGSDEFYNQKGRDVQSYIVETLQSVTWEEPTVSELRRWTDRLTALRGDRFALAREILMESDQPGGGSPAGPDLTEIAGRLVSAAKLLTDTIDFEIGGTLQGRQANLKAQALANACDQLRRIVAVTGYRPTDATLALQSVERSLAALQSTLSSPAGTAPSAAAIVRRLDAMLDEAQAVHRPGPATPAPAPGGTSSATTRSLLAQAESAARGVESIIQSLAGQAYQNYNSSIVLRDLDTFAARLGELQASLRRGVSGQRLQWEVEALSEQAARIGPQLLAGRPPAFTRLFWSSVESSLEQMADTLGIPAGESTVLRPTPSAPEILPLVDRAITRADVFLTGTQPLVFGVRDVPGVQRDVRDLKSRLLTLRQEAQSGEPAARQLDTLTSMVAAYQNAYSRWGQIVATYKLVNPPRLSPVGETLNEVEAALKRAVGGEDLTPAGGSVAQARVARLLQTLDGEVRLLREALPPFVNYPEHRPLLTYADQLDGYIASLGSLQADPASPPDAMRRQAAGLQRVVQQVQTSTEAVEARAGTRTPNDGTRLRNQGRRLITLTDDLESELH